MTQWGTPQRWQLSPYATPYASPYASPYGGPQAPYIPRPPGNGQQLAAWLLTAGLVGLGLLLALMATIGFVIHAHMESSAVATSATVVDVDRVSDKVTVDYYVQGRKLDGVTTSWYGRLPRIGDVVTIEYDPDDHDYIRQPGSREDFYLGLGLAIAAAVTFLAAVGTTVWGIHAGRSRRQAMALWRQRVPQLGFGGPPAPVNQPPYGSMLAPPAYAGPPPQAPARGEDPNPAFRLPG